MDIADIRDIIAKARRDGHDTGMKDIAFVVLERAFGDSLAAYRCLFDTVAKQRDAEDYVREPKTVYLRKAVPHDGPVKGAKTEREGGGDSDMEDLSFEENKAEMIRLLDEIREKMDSGEMEAKDGLKLMTDIRTRLNDKFGTAEKSEERRVIVNVKYNTICPTTRRECFLQTKEYAIQQWGLADMERLKEEYELVPKKKQEI